MSSVPTQYFEKEILSSPVWLPNGKQAPWEAAGDDTGILSTNDAGLIFHLNNLAQRHIGGVIRIDEERYGILKKNTNVSESPKRSQRESISGPVAAPSSLYLPRPVEAAAPVVAAVKPPVPAATPVKVRTGKAKPVTVAPL